MKYLAYFALILTVFLFLYLLLKFLYSSRINTKNRLNEIGKMALESESDSTLDASTLTLRKDTETITIPFLSKYLNKISGILTQAHILMKPMEFLLISVLAAAVMLLLGLLIFKNPILAFIFGILGFFLPRVQISMARDKRSKSLNNQLPEFLNVLSNALRAGLSLNQAIDSAAQEMQDPIKWEFQKVLRDNNLGRPLEDALNDMVKRTGDEDIEMFVSAVNIQRQVGGNLSEVLEMIADTIRARVKLKGEVRTMSAQSKMSGLIIGFLPLGIAFAISAINPGYLNPMFQETLGQIILIIAGVMMVAGGYLLKKISTLEV